MAAADAPRARPGAARAPRRRPPAPRPTDVRPTLRRPSGSTSGNPEPSAGMAPPLTAPRSRFLCRSTTSRLAAQPGFRTGR